MCPKSLISYTDVKRPQKPKPRKGVKKINVSRGGHRFPKLVVPELRAYVRTRPCLAAGEINRMTPGLLNYAFHQCRYPVECAHVRSRGAAGKDWDNVVPLCPDAHGDLHRWGRREWEYRYQLRLGPAARAVTAAFLKAFPEMRKRRAGVPPEGSP